MNWHQKPGTEKNQHLANKIAQILGIILLVVFVLLISTVTLLSKSGMTEAIGDEFSAMAKGTGLQVQNVLGSAENSANAVAQYIENEFKTSMDAGTVPSNYISAIYGKPISEKSYEAEKYITQTVRQSVKSSENIVGMGVLFEPYAFDSALSDYAFFISKSDIDSPITPYLSYNEYAAQEYYKTPRETNTAHITAPYQDAGYTMVTYCYPILVNNQMIGVVTADINVSDFSGTVFETEKYPSKYTTIIDENGIVVFDTEDLENVGAVLTNFIKDQKGLKQIQQGTDGTEAFKVEIIREDGTAEVSFYHPIVSGNMKWWAITALDKTDLNKSVTQITTILVLISIGALVVTVLLMTFFIKGKLQPINTVVEAAEKIAAGDLNIQLEAKTKDEIGRLVSAFNVTIGTLKGIITDVGYSLAELAAGNFNIQSQCPEKYVGDYRPIQDSMYLIRNNLNSTMTQINEAADQVANGSDQVSSGSQALSQGATEQASSIEELAASINEISTQVNGTAKNAVEAREQASGAENKMTLCNQQMQEMMAAMEQISSKSAEINKIIKTIEDIAFQTNILALNAAVEAARAGVAGKGFAVVADEVRSLAGKSAEASKNTSALIAGSIEAVDKGTKIANETAQSLLQVVEDAQAVAVTVERISKATNHQASSISQITQGIDQISSVVQNNSATAEESAAASEELSSQAQLLKTLVSRFKLIHSGETDAFHTQSELDAAASQTT